MWSWMSENAQVLNVWVGVGTLLVWLFYAHLLYAGFRRIRQPQILITQGWGNSIDSICLINNMSQESIYLQDIILSLYANDEVYRVSIPDFESAELEQHVDTKNLITRQGPLGSDQYIHIGTFRSLIRKAARVSELDEDDERPVETLGINGLKITAVAIYGPGGSLVAAQRKFNVRGEHNEHLQAVRVNTKQLRGPLARRWVRRWVQSRL